MTNRGRANAISEELIFFQKVFMCWFCIFSVFTYYILVIRISKHVKTKTISLTPFCAHSTQSLDRLLHSYYWRSNKTSYGNKKHESVKKVFASAPGPGMSTLHFQFVGTTLPNVLILLSPAFIDLGSCCLNHLSLQYFIII